MFHAYFEILLAGYKDGIVFFLAVIFSSCWGQANLLTPCQNRPKSLWVILYGQLENSNLEIGQFQLAYGMHVMNVYHEILIYVGTFWLNKIDDGIIISFIYSFFEILWNIFESLFYGSLAASGINHRLWFLHFDIDSLLLDKKCSSWKN